MSASSRSFYEVLEVAPDATPQEIRSAYRRLAKTLHPDMPTGSTALFGMVSEAYEVLYDADRRANYDRGRSGPTPASAPTSNASPNSTGASQGPGQGPSTGAQHGAGRQSAGTGYTQGPFAGMHEAAARTQHAPTVSRPGDAAARSAAAQPWTTAGGVNRGRGGSIAWWTFPLVLAVLSLANLARFTAGPSSVFDVKAGDRVLGVLEWSGVPSLTEAWLRSEVLLAVAALVLTAGFWWRKQQSPTPVSEKAALVVAAGLAAACLEFVTATVTGAIAVAAVAGGYAVWVWWLKGLPSPACTSQWESFPEWMRGVRSYYKRQAEMAGQRRAARREQRRAKLGRVLHWK